MDRRRAVRLAALIVAGGVVLGACAPSDPEPAVSPSGSSTSASADPSGSPTTSTTPASLLDAAEDVAIALRDEDWVALSELVDPDAGLRFSPYAYVTEASDRVFPADEVAGLGEDTDIWMWGTYAGSGKPIELTVADYRAEFVWDQDFLTAPQVAEDERIGGEGGTLNNIAEVYPAAHFVEYHFPGFDPQYEGMDWVSLRIVLQPDGDGWMLVGLVHDEWTP